MKKMVVFFCVLIVLFNSLHFIKANAVENTQYPNPIDEIAGAKRFVHNDKIALIIDSNDNLWAVGGLLTDEIGHQYPIKTNVPIFIDSNVKEVYLDVASSYSDSYYSAFGAYYLKIDGTLFSIKEPGTDEIKLPGVEILKNVTNVVIYELRTYAIDTNNDLWVWGINDYTGLSDLQGENTIYPQKIESNVAEVFQSYFDIFIIDTNRDLRLLEKSFESKLIYSNVKEVSYYYLLTNSGDVVSYSIYGSGEILLQNIKEVSFGDFVDFALSNTNELYSWGYNANGTIGNGSSLGEQIDVPYLVLNNVEEILSNGFNQAFVRRTDKSLWGWGNNIYNTIGVGTTEGIYPPTLILSNVEKVVSKTFSTIAIKYDKSMWVWGDSSTCYLSYDISNENCNGFPFLLSSGISEIYSWRDYDDQTFAKKIDGSIVAWGWPIISIGDANHGMLSERTILGNSGITSTYEPTLFSSESDNSSIQISDFYEDAVKISIQSYQITGVEIYRSTDNINFDLIGMARKDNRTYRYDFYDPSVLSDITYYYTYRPYIADYSSGYSRTVGDYVSAGSIHIPLQRPNPVLSITNVGKVNIAWTPLVGASGYEVYYLDASLGEWSKIGDTVNSQFTTTFAIPTIVGNYNFKVRGYIQTNSGKEFGIFSSGYIDTSFSMLNSWEIHVNRKTSNDYTINWDSLYHADYYELYIDFALVYSGTGLNYDWLLSSGNVSKRNTIEVKAFHEDGDTLLSETRSITVVSDEEGYNLLVSVDSNTAIKLDWTDSVRSTYHNNNPIEYLVYRSSSASFTNPMLIYTGLVSEFVDAVASTSVPYYYYVVSKNAEGYNQQMFVYSKITPSIIVTNSKLATPTGFIANSQSYSSILLSWDSVPGASGYNIYRSTTASGTYTLVASPTTTSYTNLGLAFNTTYYYKVQAYPEANSGNLLGDFTSAISAKTTLTTPVITPVSSGFDRITVSWPAVSGANGYEVYRSASSAGVYTLLTTTTAASYLNTALTINTSYYYKVRAYRLVGTTKVYSAYSSIVTTKPLPSVPSGTSAVSLSYNSLKVAWTAVSGANGYEVSWSKASDGTYTALPFQAATSITLLNQATNETVYFKVRAYRLVGTGKVFGPSSSIVSAKPIPSTPILTVASDAYNRLKISWGAIVGASGYELYALNTTSGLYEVLNDGTGLSYVHTDLISGVNHSYKIKAYTMVNDVKVYSNDSAVVTNKAIPSIPATPKALYANYNSITVSTAAVPGASGYELYRATTAAGTYVLVTSPTTTSYTNTGLAFNTTYYYKVRAYTLVGTTKVYGGYTTVVSAKTTLNTPVATAVSASYNSNRISWAAIPGMTRYELYRSTSSAGVYTLLTSLTSPSYTNINLTFNTTYYYKVRAYRLVGTVKVYSAYSAIVNARPVPSAPSVTASNLGYNSIKASWPAVAGASGYEVSKAFGTSTTFSIHGFTTALTTTLTGLTPNVNVKLRVRSYRMVGANKVFGPYSAVSTATPYPLTPVLTASVTISSVNLSWAAIPGITKYVIYHDATGAGTYEVLGESTIPSYAHEGLILGSAHAYKIVGSMMVGADEILTAASLPISRTVAAPAVSGLLASSPAYDSISLKWNTSIGASGYEVWMASTLTGVYSVLGETDQLTYLKAGLAFNTTYYFKVRPYTTDGETKVYGTHASIVSAKTSLGVPILTSKNVSATSINLTWLAISGVTGYEITRATTATGTYTLQTTTGLLTYTKTALIKGTVYYYKVRAYRLVGTVKVYGAYSTPKYVKVGY